MLFNIWVTRNCNFRCKYCYVPEYDTNLTIENADEIVFFIKKQMSINYKDKDIIVNFHGGEPLLNFACIEYIVNSIDECFLKTHSVHYGLTTNGTLLNQDISSYLAQKFKFNLSVSIDGMPNCHDKYRKYVDGRDTYVDVIEKAQFLNTLTNDLRIRMTYDSKTLPYLYENILHLFILGFRNFVAVPNLFDKWQENDIKIFRRELQKIFKKFALNKNISVNFIDDDVTSYKGKCNGGITSVNIDIYGDIYPCTWAVGNKEFIIGNIKDGINNNKLTDILSHSTKINNECSECGLSRSCTGTRCIIINKVITGEYNTPPVWRCMHNNIIYEFQKNIWGR